MRGRTIRWFALTLFGAMVCLAVGALLVWKLRPIPPSVAESDVKVVENFDDGTERNLIGGERFTQAFGDAHIAHALLRLPTPSSGELACALTYELPKGGTASWGTGLNDLDISAATTLQFWLKTERLPLPELSVELTDGIGSKAQVKVPRRRSTTNWQRVSIARQAFRGVQFDRLATWALRLTAPTQPLQGRIYLDDLQFVGPPSLFFKSLADNLFGFPQRALVDPERLLQLPADQMLRAMAGDLWGYFRDLVDKRHHLPMNYVQLQPIPILGDYASPSDISMYLMSVVSAVDFDFIDYSTALARLRGTLHQLEQLPRWRGFFYNYYNTTNLQITSQYISSVDNAWLVVALVILRQAFPELAAEANQLMEPMDFSTFYDPQNGQIRLGYEMEHGRFAPYHYGLLATEARIISIVAIGLGHLPPEHWFRIYRTLPKEWTWQRQTPQGSYRTYLGHDVFNGYYTYEHSERTSFVPSWGGSLFEFLMPTLVVDERHLAPHGLGLNDQRAIELHMRYALQERGYPVWGLSPCATPKERHGGYSEFGVAALGSKGYKDEAIVTPHVTLLALPFVPDAAKENLKELLRRYQLYGPYGLYDSVDVKSGEVAYRYLSLDQGMSLIALDNYLNDRAIQRRFEADPIMKAVEPLLQTERFFDEIDSTVK